MIDWPIDWLQNDYARNSHDQKICTKNHSARSSNYSARCLRPLQEIRKLARPIAAARQTPTSEFTAQCSSCCDNQQQRCGSRLPLQLPRYEAAASAGATATAAVSRCELRRGAAAVEAPAAVTASSWQVDCWLEQSCCYKKRARNLTRACGFNAYDTVWRISPQTLCLRSAN